MGMLDYGKPVHKCRPPILFKPVIYDGDDHRLLDNGQHTGILTEHKVYPRAQWQCDTCGAVWRLSASFEWIQMIGDPGPAHPPKATWTPTPDYVYGPPKRRRWTWKIL